MMARISDRNTKDSSGGYQRLFGVQELGYLISKVHGAVISAGSELERIILEKVDNIENLDEFLVPEIMPEGVFIAPKSQIKKCNQLDSLDAEPDFLVFKRRKGRQDCYVIELKDGDTFDTKKAAAERKALHSFTQYNGSQIHYKMHIFVCCFNQNDKKTIVQGFKNEFNENEVLTGIDFCKLLEIDYNEIVNMRKKDQHENFNYFITELLKIEQVEKEIRKVFGNALDNK